MTLTWVKDDLHPHLGGNIAEGDPWTYCPTVWKYLIDRFAIRSVLDLGSGLGYSARWFAKHGMDVLAVDGLVRNCQNAVYPTICVDLTRSDIMCRVDLVHCQEVVEHIGEEHLKNLMASLSRGKFLCMTHAAPGQSGHHHVNCQPEQYWKVQLEYWGMDFLEIDTQRVRVYAGLDGAEHMARSGLVFANRRLVSPGRLG